MQVSVGVRATVVRGQVFGWLVMVLGPYVAGRRSVIGPNGRYLGYEAFARVDPCGDHAGDAAPGAWRHTVVVHVAAATPLGHFETGALHGVRRRPTLVLVRRSGAATAPSRSDLSRHRGIPDGSTPARQHLWALWPSPLARPRHGHRHLVPDRAEPTATAPSGGHAAALGQDPTESRRGRSPGYDVPSGNAALLAGGSN